MRFISLNAWPTFYEVLVNYCYCEFYSLIILEMEIHVKLL